VGRGLFDGSIFVRDGLIEGIITERAPNAPAPQITVRDQYDRVVAEGPAVLAANNELHKPSMGRIDLRLLPECFGCDELELRAYANGVHFATAFCRAGLRGYLDQLTEDRCQGWLFSPDAPRHRFEIAVFYGEERIGGGPCELPREDLREMHPQAFRAGFDLPLRRPRGLADRTAPISIRLVGSGFELFDGPFLLGDHAAQVRTARKAAARSLADPSLSFAEKHCVQTAMAEFIDRRRHGAASVRQRMIPARPALPLVRRLNIVIPVYKGLEVTRACIESVLATRDDFWDAVILVNDASPDPAIAPMLRSFAQAPNLHLLDNPQNLGFVGSVNRALAFCRCGDLVLLNSDTVVFPGAWDELARLLEAGPDIGTITALSNNATIFSYPHPSLRAEQPPPDTSWAELAAAALAENASCVVDVPTGHGFCMAVRREALDRVGHLDTRFGRGYGEENDLCARIADLGWRNVAACGVLVEHRESVSFGGDKAALIHTNIAQLNRLYPEYTPTIMEYERRDGLRSARWPLDRLRLRRAREAGARFALVVQNWLDGGTKTAINDIALAYGYGGRERLTLTVRADGIRELTAATPSIQAVFASDEDDALFSILEDAAADLVQVHQLMGYTAAFIRRLGPWGATRDMTYYVHDFYCICPRVTMLNAVNRFCEAAHADTCARCVEMGGAHEASRLTALSPAEHRALFADFLRHCLAIIAPSSDAVRWAARIFPDIPITAEPHPQLGIVFSDSVRDGDPQQIALLGAIGPHKGSRKLLELAQEARLTHPDLHFHVIGYTDIDRELLAVGNVTITGAYDAADLPNLVTKSRAAVALFLHKWPETFSYTLSEAWSLGLWVISPDIGAPAERVKNRRFGSVVPTECRLADITAAIARDFPRSLRGDKVRISK
jgi:GT2 family glycosyltransferase